MYRHNDIDLQSNMSGYYGYHCSWFGCGIFDFDKFIVEHKLIMLTNEEAFMEEL